jgi:hypothetical protein
MYKVRNMCYGNRSQIYLSHFCHLIFPEPQPLACATEHYRGYPILFVAFAIHQERRPILERRNPSPATRSAFENEAW